MFLLYADDLARLKGFPSSQKACSAATITFSDSFFDTPCISARINANSTNRFSVPSSGFTVGSAAASTFAVRLGLAPADTGALVSAVSGSLGDAEHPVRATSAATARIVPPRFIMCRSLWQPINRNPKDDPLDLDELFLHNHILTEYQQEVHRLKFELARANAQCAAKDNTIAELRTQLEVDDDQGRDIQAAG